MLIATSRIAQERKARPSLFIGRELGALGWIDKVKPPAGKARHRLEPTLAAVGRFIIGRHALNIHRRDRAAVEEGLSHKLL